MLSMQVRKLGNWLHFLAISKLNLSVYKCVHRCVDAHAHTSLKFVHPDWAIWVMFCQGYPGQTRFKSYLQIGSCAMQIKECMIWKCNNANIHSLWDTPTVCNCFLMFTSARKPHPYYVCVRMTIVDWNLLPHHLIELKSIDLFVASVCMHLSS